MRENWKEDLLSEKSLRQAYIVSKSLARSTFNWWTYRVGIAVATIVAVVWIYSGDAKHSYEAVLEIAETGFDLSVQILGFLIGGFAIFATISDSRLMVRLAQTKMKDSELSVFKTIFYNFISVFYIYVVTLGGAVTVKTGSTVHIVGPDSISEEWRSYALSAINGLVFVAMAAAVLLCILRLKSFIWNIYQAFLTLLIGGEVVRLSEEQRERDAGRES